MAGEDFDAAFGAFGDPNPPGTTTAIGNTAQNPNDPLIDWASNLNKDDLARFLHDPQAHIQDLAARGIPPPSEDAVQRIHDLNEQAGTPSRSDRFSVQPQAQDALAGPVYRTDPQTGRLVGNLSDTDAARAAVGGQRPTAPAFTQEQAAQAGLPTGRVGTPSTSVWPPAPRPNAPELPGGVVYSSGSPTGYVDAKTGQPVQPPTTPTTPTAPAPAAPVPLPVPRPENATPVTPALGGGAPTLVKPAGARVARASEEIPGAALEPEPAAGTPATEGGTPDAKKELAGKEKTKLQKVDDALSDLGKAMQGVKAPPPLSPPNIGAPSVRSPQGISGGAAALQALLQGRQQGLTPASIMPILHLLGRV